MRLNYIVPTQSGSQYITISDIHIACSNFFNTYKTVPDTLKMSYSNMSSFISLNLHMQVKVLEAGKKYSQFLTVPGGMIELLIFDETDETTVSSGGTLLVLENSQVDREFEKHVLNKDNN